MNYPVQLTAESTVTAYDKILMEKLENRTAKIGILGLGYVGLPLAVATASAGFEVMGIELSSAKVETLNEGKSYIPDIPAEEIAPLVQRRKLYASTNPNLLQDADVVVICVPTPLNKTRDPDMTYIVSAVDMVAKIKHPGMLVVLESTTYPGTTMELLVPHLATHSFIIGKNLFVAFSPERIDPGNQHFTIRNTPKIVGGVSENCTRLAATFYRAVVEKVITVSSPTSAEMVKLLENTFRAVNIGLVNEFSIICDKLGVDVWEIIDAASSKPFGFTPFYPGPGLGGHCIPIDPLYLSWKLKALNYTARFIELARDVNTAMPQRVVDKISTSLNLTGKPIRNSRIAIMGVAYKRDIDDVRESPALEVIDLLHSYGASISYNDPYVDRIQLQNGQFLESVKYSTDWLASADCVVILTDHSCFNYEEILTYSYFVVDTRNATNRRKGFSHVVKL